MVDEELRSGFPRRFKSLLNTRNLTQFEEETGIKRPTAGLLANGKRLPGAAMLREICVKCNVSADWLLGISDVKNPKADIQAVCKYTGLSEDAIKALSFFQCNDMMDELNFLLKDISFHCLVNTMHNLKKTQEASTRVIPSEEKDNVLACKQYLNDRGYFVGDFHSLQKSQSLDVAEQINDSIYDYLKMHREVEE